MSDQVFVDANLIVGVVLHVILNYIIILLDGPVQIAQLPLL